MSRELSAGTVPTSRRLVAGAVFEEFVPKLRPEFVPERRWRTLDFGEDDHGGEMTIEVVEHLNAVMRKVSLTRSFEDDNPNGSS